MLPEILPEDPPPELVNNLRPTPDMKHVNKAVACSSYRFVKMVSEDNCGGIVPSISLSLKKKWTSPVREPSTDGMDPETFVYETTISCAHKHVTNQALVWGYIVVQGEWCWKERVAAAYKEIISLSH